MTSARFLRWMLGLGLVLTSTGAFAQVTGTKNIPGDYATLALAVTDLNTQGVGAGGVTLNLIAGNPQSAPAGGYVVTATGTAPNPIAIVCNGNTITAPTPQTSGALNDAIFKLIGADYVTINGCVLNENAANTTTTAASNNMTEWGIALLYATTTDGAQNATLQGNTITLNRTYQNTFGIYSNSTHSATAVSTSATATTIAGGNSGLKIYGNTISNVNVGIVVVGPTAAADHNEIVDVGGAALATGNTITNFGTTGTFSSYANVSGTVNGILVRNSRNFNISFNNITSSVGGVTAGTLNGIQIPAASVVPTGTLVNTINNNNISLKSGAITGVTNGINVVSGSASTATTLSISSNNFSDSGHTVAGTAAISFILNASATRNTNINNNTFTNLSVNTTGNVTFISNSVTHPAGAVTNVNNNAIVGTFAKTGASGTVRLYDAVGSTTTGSETNSGNNFSNITLTGAATFGGWRCADGATPFPSKTVTNNTFSNIVGGTAAITVLDVSFSSSTTITGNLVSSITGGAGIGAVVGITSSSGTQLFESNTVHTITASTTSSVSGISLTGGTVQTLSRNKVYSIENSNAAPTSANGILITGGTTINLYNNLIGDIRAANASASNPVNGINITGGATVNAAYNTVRLQATSVGANFGSSALSASSTPTLALNNNALVNLSTAAGTGLTVAYRRSSTTLTTYPNTSNYNSFYAGTPSATNLIFNDGSNSDQTLGAYKARVTPRDSVSATENPPFLSTTGSASTFLHIDPVVATPVESGGAAFAGVTVDFDGDTRNASTPDIGADEFNGIALDVNGPIISYTALTSTSLASNRTLSATLTDNTGVATGGLAPRIYYRKNAGGYFSQACSLNSGTVNNGSWNCIVNNADMGGVVATDVVDYFVIAQDTVGNITSNPFGAVAVDVNTVTTPPTLKTYTIVAAFSGSIPVGTGETYTSLTNSGGIFEAINAGALVGNVSIDITSDLTAETGTNALNQWIEDGVGGYTLLIRPSGAPRTVAGTNTDALIRLNGADRVTIDGSTTGGTATGIGGNAGLRELTIQNTNVGTSAVVIAVQSGAAGAQNNTIRNVNVLGQDPTTTLVGITLGGAGPGLSSGADNDGNRIENCTIKRSIHGIFSGGQSLANPNIGSVFTMNDLSATDTDRLRRIGILVFGDIGTQITLNSIGGLDTDESVDAIGIGLGINQNIDGIASSSGGVTGALVSRNRINGVRNRSTSSGSAGDSAAGIAVAGSPGAANVIANNMISGVIAPAIPGGIVAGVYIASAAPASTRVLYNSISMSGDRGAAATQVPSFGIAITDSNPTVELKNNAVATTQISNSAVSAKSYAIGMIATTFTNLDANYNDYYSSGANAGFFRTGSLFGAQGTDYATVAAWGAAVADDANSLQIDPLFVSATDLHLQTGSTLIGAGEAIAGVIDDFDNDSRLLSTPDIGADEYVPPNTAPTISAVGVTRRAGDAGANAAVANVLDAEDAENTLAMTVNAAASATVNGVTVSGLAVSAAGVATADVLAACGATSATFTLRVTDSGTLFNEATLNVTVNPNLPPTLSYPGISTAVFGQSLNVNPASGPSDSGSISSLGVSNTGTYTGGLSVDNAGVVSLTGAAPVGGHAITIQAIDNCMVSTDATLNLVIGQADTTTTINTDAPDPSVTGSNVVVTYSVAPVAPGAGTPTGTVTVTDGVNNCSASVAAGQCTVALVTVGARTLTATYAGDGNFTGSGDTESHQVDPPANTAPTIAAAGVTRRSGDAGASATIANVTDAEDALNTLAVTVNGGATATVNSVTVNGISTSVAGVVSANVVAACGATSANFTLRVTDSGTLFNESTLNVTVNPNLAPTLTYAALTNAVFGQNLNVNPATGPSDSGSVSSVAVQGAGTYTGGLSVNSGGVVSLTSAAPVGSHTIVIRAIDNCNATTDANLALTVGQAATTTAITNDTPDPTTAGQSFTVSYTVVANAPGAGTPAGNVSVSDGVDSCTATVAAGQCSLALSTPGNRTLTATYAGNTSFATSSATAPHTVSPTANLAIVKTVNDALIGSGVIQYSITVSNAGPSAVTGATVVDTFPAGVSGVTWTCAGTVGGTCTASGSGNINDAANLPNGASVVYSITGNVTLPLPTSISNTATVTAPVGTTDPSLANNTSTAVAVILFFRDGFEGGPVAAPVAVKLSLAPNGAVSTLALPVGEVIGLASTPEPVEVIRFQVQTSLVVVQTRHLGGVAQARTLQVNAPGNWSVSEWIAVDQSGALSFEWAAGAPGAPLTQLRIEQ